MIVATERRPFVADAVFIPDSAIWTDSQGEHADPDRCVKLMVDAYECRRRGRVRFESVDLNGLIGRKTLVFDQVVFRIDVRRFIGTLTLRNQSLAGDLATGMTTTEAAAKYRVTPGAIAQFRARFKKWHDQFFAE